MSSSNGGSTSVRSRADAVWQRAKDTAHKEREAQSIAERAKTARLRELRLAKEAADKAAAEAESASLLALKAAAKKRKAPKAATGA